ncbi:hypothetical protein GF412_04505 [Candidatus Micrarchaeota archaeon]|nr:hypothetical protein [Candidatus Micrarchaeota archaeon]MBD3418213.1 hypothetical protein [Candidatus Micrarchaeota archaeon]
MALQTREARLGRTKKFGMLVNRAATKIFRNRRPLGVFATGAATAVGYLATGTARPELALLFNTCCSMDNARTSMEISDGLRKHGHRRSAQTVSYAGSIDLANMVLSFIPFVSWLHNSPNYTKNAFVYMGVLAVTGLAAQKIEKRARFVLLKEKFGSPFHNMGMGECIEYLLGLEKMEKSWWRRPYWMFRPEKLEAIISEKEKIQGYVKDRMRSKSL